eukprot:5605805-Amphidinium_carterae.1
MPTAITPRLMVGFEVFFLGNRSRKMDSSVVVCTDLLMLYSAFSQGPCDKSDLTSSRAWRIDHISHPRKQLIGVQSAFVLSL